MAFGNIGMALFNQRRNHRNHAVDEFCGTRFMVGRQRAKRRNILMKAADRIFAQPANINLAFSRACDDLVIHIGDIAHIGNLVEPVAQQPHQHVEHHDRARIANMDAVIDGGAAGIYADIFWIKRGKGRLFAGQGIIQRDFGHAVSPRRRA